MLQKILLIALPFLYKSQDNKLTGPISNCIAYGESYDVKGKEICDFCEIGYTLSVDERQCDQTSLNCQALFETVGNKCWSCNAGFMFEDTTNYQCVANTGQVQYCQKYLKNSNQNDCISCLYPFTLIGYSCNIAMCKNSIKNSTGLFCDQCVDGYGLGLKNQQCKPNHSEYGVKGCSVIYLNFQRYDVTLYNALPWTCVECQSGFTFQNGQCLFSSIIQFQLLALLTLLFLLL